MLLCGLHTLLSAVLALTPLPPEAGLEREVREEPLADLHPVAAASSRTDSAPAPAPIDGAAPAFDSSDEIWLPRARSLQLEPHPAAARSASDLVLGPIDSLERRLPPRLLEGGPLVAVVAWPGQWSGGTPMRRGLLYADQNPRHLGPFDPAAEPQHLLGASLAAVGRYDDADPYLARSVLLRERSLGRDHPLSQAARATWGALRSALTPGTQP